MEFSEPILNTPFSVIEQELRDYKTSVKDSLSEESWQLLNQVEQEAEARRHNFAGTADLLLMLTNQPAIQGGVLTKLGVSSEEIQARINRIIYPEHSAMVRPEFLGYTERLEQSLNLAVAKAQLDDRQMDLDDLFYGLAMARGFAAKLLNSFGINQTKLIKDGVLSKDQMCQAYRLSRHPKVISQVS